MQKVDTVVIGAGAAGICAAISAKRARRGVVMLDRMPVIGKKVLASGNGRCNLLNEDLNESFYNASARQLVKTVFARYGKKELLELFKELGVMTCSDSGRIFPVTNQSSSVLKAFQMELERLAVPVELNFTVENISRQGTEFSVKSKNGKEVRCAKLIIASGGKSYPALGSDGSCYRLVQALGHRIVPPVPACVPMVVKDRLCHLLQGQKISAGAKVLIGGKVAKKANGEVLFTKYGLSGTAILDVSEEASIAINRMAVKVVDVSIDMVPFMEQAVLEKELDKRIKQKLSIQDMLIGILPNKFGPALKDELAGKSASSMAAVLKNRIFKVDQARGWNEAEFTAGGVDIKDVDEKTLESKLVKGLYFAGEILDVCGARGGYNLAWAWASGIVAGKAGAA